MDAARCSRERIFKSIADGAKGGKNHLDTREGIFAKDIGEAREIVANLQLSLAEKLRIVDAARLLGFFAHVHQEKREITETVSSDGLPIFYEIDPGMSHWTAVIRISTAEEENWVQWDSQTPKSDSWRQMDSLMTCIIRIVESKPEYKALPRAKYTM
ncbi:MAG: hypothetical protein WC824_03555 [Bacteroidota bacterium]